MLDKATRLAQALADRYSIERELGAGGMATLYLARDLKHDRRVAIKVVRPDVALVVGGERFLREITTTAGLRHPSILPLYDSGDINGFLYYVMPFVEGESLRDRLNRDKQLPIEEALQIAAEVAGAVAYAHDRGVLHRDIKPENILLESGHAVVADFGIARAIDNAGGDRLTETGVIIGTPQYMSPEQSAGEQDLDGRSDQYALACVTYEMLAGEPPFVGPTIESVLRQHMLRPPARITRVRGAISEEVAATIERALAKTPADRFATTAEFRDALIRQNVAAPTVPPPVASAPSRKSRLSLAITLVVVALLAIIATALLRRG
jgi:eukaryotic-like serine/threonine-protein kinase